MTETITRKVYYYFHKTRKLLLLMITGIDALQPKSLTYFVLWLIKYLQVIGGSNFNIFPVVGRFHANKTYIIVLPYDIFWCNYAFCTSISFHICVHKILLLNGMEHFSRSKWNIRKPEMKKNVGLMVTVITKLCFHQWNQECKYRLVKPFKNLNLKYGFAIVAKPFFQVPSIQTEKCK